VKRTQDDKWKLNLAAAKVFHTREGHLVVPRKHVEHLAGARGGPGGVQGGTGGREVVRVK
jgi:hypothetical protein